MFITVYGLSKLNINLMYSAFIAGYLMKAIVSQNNKDIEKIKDIAFSFFTPVYFALVGLQLDVINDFSISRFFTFFEIAFGLEFIGTVMVMLFTKLKKKTIFSLGITMNARGGPGIVLATTAFAYNIINIEFFTVIILTTMLSSMIAGYWLRAVKEDVQYDT
jgi:Kef-type K+ transport system membrane component KefB